MINPEIEKLLEISIASISLAVVSPGNSKMNYTRATYSLNVIEMMQSLSY